MTEQEIFNKYAYLFEERFKPPSDSCMCDGCAHDDGWLPLIDKLCTVIVKIDKSHLVRFTQIKEKFGELDVHFKILNDDGKFWTSIYKLTEKYRRKSLKICEICGKHGKKRNIDGLKKVLCTKDLLAFQSPA
ncbi:MAG: hypothetical protein Q7R33_01740 [Nitrosarchaeum sp.]|nr:hypothetical protein [Nitrosarchaeum sp.]